jgi:hypothetical protein
VQQQCSCSSDAAVVLVLSSLCLALFSVSFKLTLKLIVVALSHSGSTGSKRPKPPVSGCNDPLLLHAFVGAVCCAVCARVSAVSSVSKASQICRPFTSLFPYISRPCGRARHEADIWPGPRAVRCEEVRHITSLGSWLSEQKVYGCGIHLGWAQASFRTFCLLR